MPTKERRGNIGARIKDLRRAAGLRQADVAEQIQIEPESLSRIETGKLRASTRTLEAIAKAVGVSPSRFYDDAPVAPVTQALRPVERRAVRLLKTLTESDAEIVVRSLEALLRIGR
jgi:transcriptional regulator with XRE-family HTH domain